MESSSSRADVVMRWATVGFRCLGSGVLGPSPLVSCVVLLSVCVGNDLISPEKRKDNRTYNQASVPSYQASVPS